MVLKKKNTVSLFNIFPNPTTGYIWLQAAGRMENAVFNVYNAEGKKVLEQNINNSVAGTTINMSHLAAGVYTIVIKTASTSEIHKIIKQ